MLLVVAATQKQRIDKNVTSSLSCRAPLLLDLNKQKVSHLNRPVYSSNCLIYKVLSYKLSTKKQQQKYQPLLNFF